MSFNSFFNTLFEENDPWITKVGGQVLVGYAKPLSPDAKFSCRIHSSAYSKSTDDSLKKPKEKDSIIPNSDELYPLSDFSGKRFESLYLPNENILTNSSFINNSKTESIITKETPGFHKEEISLDVQDGVLTIKGKKKDDFEYPISIKPFTDSYRLSNNSDIENISAKLENGILTITIPKKLKECKKIEIL